MSETLVETPAIAITSPSSISTSGSTSTSTSTSTPNPTVPSRPRTRIRGPTHGEGLYFIYKCIGMTIYTWILSLYLSVDTYYWYKLITCIVFTPLIKYHTIYRTARTDSKVMRHWIYSIITDTIGALWVLYFTRFYLQECMILFPLLNVLVYMAIEACEYYLFDYGSGTYVIKSSSSPFDFLLVFVICGTYWLLGNHVNFMAELDVWSFPKYIALWFVFDITFGLSHYYSHHVPALWKKHKTHHEYKRDELNSFANFYAEFSDSFMMNIPFFSSAVGAIFLQGDAYRMMMDAGPVVGQSHTKYCHLHTHMFHYWEYDAIDLIFQRIRIAEYHFGHHNELTSYIGATGFLSDEFFEKYCPDLKPYFPSLYKVE